MTLLFNSFALGSTFSSKFSVIFRTVGQKEKKNLRIGSGSKLFAEHKSASVIDTSWYCKVDITFVF